MSELMGDSLTISYIIGECTVRVYHAAQGFFAIFKPFLWLSIIQARSNEF